MPSPPPASDTGQAESGPSSAVLSFADLGLPDALVSELARQGIERPFEVQAATIPDALAGRDVLGRAPTGSGKTLAFGLPLLARVGKGAPKRPRALVLAPTRELAEQIRREIEPLAAAVDRKVAVVYGGVSFGPQLRALKGADVLVACPGRLQDLIDQGELSLDATDVVVVDEADRMADMGFLPAVRQLLDLTAAQRQTVLFSATLDRDVQILIEQYQSDPVRHEVGEIEPDLSQVTHRFIATRKESKLNLTAQLVEDSGPTMVFCRTRHGVDRVARQLKRVGVKAGWIHGGRTQRQRDAALDAFVSGRVAALVATDVAARGIHVDGVACVVHYDPPADHKDYVHRSGRTARAGSSGVVVSLVNSDQRSAVSRLQKRVGLPVENPESEPELRPRDEVEWVDQRPSRSNKRQGGKTKPTTASRQAGRKTGSGAEGRPESRRKADDNPSEGRRKTRENKRGDRGRTRDTGDEGAGADPGTKSQGAPKRTRKAGSKSANGPGTGTGTGRKAKAKARSKAKAASGGSTKRSGRPRSKDHKKKRA